MKIFYLIITFCFILFLGVTQLNEREEPIPDYLYKILSVENWQKSQTSSNLQLDAEDSPFIHLATDAQLPRIIDKYWSNANSYVIVKIQTKNLKGRLVLESNPGGTNKYYHLYEGFIPLNSVVDYELIQH